MKWLRTGDITRDIRVEVIDSGYTQGSNQAQLRIITDSVPGATFNAVGGVAQDIGDGLSITFAAESPTLGALTATDPGAADTYACNVTNNIAGTPDAFVGEDGDGTYTLRITQAGATGFASYKVFKDNVEIVPEQTLVICSV